MSKLILLPERAATLVEKEQQRTIALTSIGIVGAILAGIVILLVHIASLDHVNLPETADNQVVELMGAKPNSQVAGAATTFEPASPTPEPSPSPIPTSTTNPTPSPSLTPTPTPTSSPTSAPTQTPAPSSIPEPSPTPTPTIQPSQTPTPTLTSTPTPTP